MEFKIVLDDDSLITHVLDKFSDDGRIDSEIIKKSVVSYIFNQDLREIIDEYYECVKDAKFSDALENVLNSFETSMDSAEILYRDALKFIDDLSKDYSFYDAEIELIPPVVIHGLYDCFSQAQDNLSDAEDFYEVVKSLDGIRAWKLQLRLKQGIERVNSFRDQFLSTFGVDLFNLDENDVTQEEY